MSLSITNTIYLVDINISMSQSHINRQASANHKNILLANDNPGVSWWSGNIELRDLKSSQHQISWSRFYLSIWPWNYNYYQLLKLWISRTPYIKIANTQNANLYQSTWEGGWEIYKKNFHFIVKTSLKSFSIWLNIFL